MMRVADQLILVVDHTKFGKRAVVKLCDMDELDIIVTDNSVDEATRRWLDGLKAKVIFAHQGAGKETRIGALRKG